MDNLLEHFGMISASTLLLRWAGSSCGYLGVSQNRESPVVAMVVSILVLRITKINGLMTGPGVPPWCPHDLGSLHFNSISDHFVIFNALQDIDGNNIQAMGIHRRNGHLTGKPMTWNRHNCGNHRVPGWTAVVQSLLLFSLRFPAVMNELLIVTLFFWSILNISNIYQTIRAKQPKNRLAWQRITIGQNCPKAFKPLILNLCCCLKIPSDIWDIIGIWLLGQPWLDTLVL